ncbi:MAG TPA: class I SAM-dependent methyltransferase [Epsilonproteobacteria bacterium]|nr:class I SAM-dependent methyltransferase [Campylobacterota bacterium]
MKFTTHSLFEIITYLASHLKQSNWCSFEVLNPDLFEHTYNGEIVTVNGEDYLYRGLKAWVNLAELLGCKISIPTIKSNNLVEITFKKLQTSNSFHTLQPISKEEKYGSNSLFAKIQKNEEPNFLYHYKKALESVSISQRKNILNLGINRGDEFEIIKSMMSLEDFSKLNLVGIDHSYSALQIAKERFPQASFLKDDINDMSKLNLGRFGLIISIGTLQTPSINYKQFLMYLVQNHLDANSAIILGFPNSRWIDGELLYGAKAPNYNYAEMSLMFNDVIFAKKYLQQKKFRVTITGREYIFVTATKIGSSQKRPYDKGHH